MAYKYLEGLSARESLELLENRREKIASRLEEIISAISPIQDMQTAKLDKHRDLDRDDADDKSKLDTNILEGKQDSTKNLSMDLKDFLSNYYTGEIDWIDELIYGLRGKLP